MKRILSLILIITWTGAAYGDACGSALTGTFNAYQATKLCSQGFQFTQRTLNFETLAGAGTTQGTATAISGTKFNHRLTGANGVVGWILPAVTAAKTGDMHIFLNTTAGVVNLYPETGGTINGAAANAVFAAAPLIVPPVSG